MSRETLTSLEGCEGRAQRREHSRIVIVFNSSDSRCKISAVIGMRFRSDTRLSLSAALLKRGLFEVAFCNFSRLVCAQPLPGPHSLIDRSYDFDH